MRGMKGLLFLYGVYVDSYKQDAGPQPRKSPKERDPTSLWGHVVADLRSTSQTHLWDTIPHLSQPHLKPIPMQGSYCMML